MIAPFESEIYIVNTNLQDMGVDSEERAPITIDLADVEAYFHSYEDDESHCTRVKMKSGESYTLLMPYEEFKKQINKIKQ